MATADEWYSLDDIKKYKAHWNIIYGRRGNGKTTAVLTEGLKVFKKTGGKLAIIRRLREDFQLPKRSRDLCNALFTPGLNDEYPDGVVQTLFPGQYNKITYRGLEWRLAFEDQDGKIVRRSEPFAIGFALNTSTSDKGLTNMNFETILFDEFMDRRGYLFKEFVTLSNLISTLVRSQAKAKIYLVGNPVNAYCPYFREMGLKRALELKPGDIRLYKYANSKLRVAVHYADAKNNGLESDVYFGFDNPELKMITNGEWEIENYPRRPCHYKPIDILYTSYLYFDEYWYRCEIVAAENMFFMYISYQEKEPVVGDDVLVYSTDDSARPNYRKNILKPMSRVEKQIYNLFRQDKVFYDDNMTGEAVRNYFLWCSKR